MKWFQVESNTPRDPKIRRVLREFGNGGFGALVRLWCFVAEHGGRIGYSVDGDDRPYPIEDLAEAAGVNVPQVRKLLNLCAATGHISKALWETRQIVHLPAMVARADEFTKKQLRKGTPREPQQQFLTPESGQNPESRRSDAGQNPVTVQDSTNNTVQDKTEEGDARPSRAELESWFTDQFWPAYPKHRRVAKADALKAAGKLRRADLPAVITGLKGWCQTRDWQKDDGQFVPHPATFLNGKRWDDVPPPWVPPVAAPPPPGRTGPSAPGKYSGVTRRDGAVH